jgi:hypothetical protein
MVRCPRRPIRRSAFAWSVSVSCSAGPCWKASAAWTRNLAAAISRTTIFAFAPAWRVQARIAQDSFRASYRRADFQRGKNRLSRQHGAKLGIVQSQVGHAQGRSLEKGYRFPSAAPQGLALRLPLPDLKDSHTSTLEGRCWIDKTLPVVAPKKSSRQRRPLSRFHRARCSATWARRANWFAEAMARSLDSRPCPPLSARPYHPEAYCCWRKSRKPPATPTRPGVAPPRRATWRRVGRRPNNFSKVICAARPSRSG